MRLLLDTHILIWTLHDPDRLDHTTRDHIEDGANQVFFSAVSIWEIAIKAKLGRADFAFSPDAILDGALATGFAELPISANVAARVLALPMHHRDPFDRLLVAQAMAEPAHLYTADPVLRPYSELVHVIG